MKLILIYLFCIQHNTNYTITSSDLFRHVYASFITSVTYDPQTFKMTPTWFIQRVPMTLKVKMQGKTPSKQINGLWTIQSCFVRKY